MESQQASTNDIAAPVTQYNAAYLRLLSEKYGGDSTVNEIRVINSIIRAYFAGRDVGVSSMADELKIPKSTVSRAVSKLEKQGWVCQEYSSADGRRRNIRMSNKSIEHIEDEKHFLFQFWRSVIADGTKDAKSAKYPDRRGR